MAYIAVYRLAANSNDQGPLANNLTDNTVTYVNGHAVYNGSTSYSQKTSVSNLPTGALTATLYGTIFCPAGVTNYPGMAGFGKDQTNGMYGLGFYGAGKIAYLGYSNDLSWTYAHPVGKWFHYALTTYPTKKVQLYIDGVAVVAEGTLTNTMNIASSFIFVGEQRPALDKLAASIKNVRIIDSAFNNQTLKTHAAYFLGKLQC